MIRRRTTVVFSLYFLFLLLNCAPFSQAQARNNKPRSQKTNQDPSIPIFRERVRRVLVDVVVRDSNGKPVHDLSAKDFTVAEDGKGQRILSFEEYKFDAPSISLPPHAPALPPNIFINVPAAPQHGPLYVLFYDMANMEQDDQISARRHLVDFINNKPAGTRFAIYVNSDGLHLIQGFTDDKNRLLTVVDPHHHGPHIPMSFLMARNFGKGDAISSMHMLTHIAAFLDGLPGRKNLIWMAGQFPVALYPKEGDPQDMRDDIRRAMDTLNRAQVAIYPVNIRGVVTNAEGALTGLTPYGGSTSVEPLSPASSGGGTQGTSAPAASGTAPGGTADRSTAALRTAHGLQGSGVSDSLMGGYLVENDIATATGGQAFHGDNNLNALLAEATEDGGNYYSLSYSPSNPNYNGSLRNIRVSLEKPGYRLSYRRSYFADDPDQPLAESKRDSESDDDTAVNNATSARERPLYASLHHGAPLLHELIVKIHILAVGSPAVASPAQMAHLAEQPAYARGKHKNPELKLPKDLQLQRYAIYYLIAAQQIKSAKDVPLPLEFAAVAYDPEGAVLNGVFEMAADDALDSLAAQEKKARSVYEALQLLDVPTGAASIRVAVRDTSTNRVGAMEIPLPIAAEMQSNKISQTTPEPEKAH